MKDKKSKTKLSTKNSGSRNKTHGKIDIDIIIVIAIIIFLGIIMLSKTSNVSEFLNKKHKLIKSDKIIESFTEPKIYNTPRDFELYKIDKDLNEVTFIFSSPTPHIVGNQAHEYMLVLNSYVDLPEPNSNNERKLLDTKLIIKKKEDLRGNNVNLVRMGKLVFTIDAPPKEYIYYNDNNEENNQIITYKVGLIAKYPNMYSKVVHCSNKTNGEFDMVDNFQYLESKMLKELGKEYNVEPNPKINDELDDSLEVPEELSTNAKYEQLKEQIGGYPINMILDEHTGVNSLDHFLKQSPDKYNININTNLLDNINIIPNIQDVQPNTAN
jgi:hypothetical protein